MRDLSVTLTADGSSDAVLLPILVWLLREVHGVSVAGREFARFDGLSSRPTTLGDRMHLSVRLFPAKVLFVHRDSESQSPVDRIREITHAYETLCKRDPGFAVAVVPVVPVRMTEAWLLFDEGAIRSAAGNPNGTMSLNLPRLQRIETLPDPKERLIQALMDATGLAGRRRTKFRPEQAIQNLASHLVRFDPLLGLDAVRRLNASMERARNADWAPGCYSPL